MNPLPRPRNHRCLVQHRLVIIVLELQPQASGGNVFGSCGSRFRVRAGFGTTSDGGNEAGFEETEREVEELVGLREGGGAEARPSRVLKVGESVGEVDKRHGGCSFGWRIEGRSRGVEAWV